MGLDWLDPQLLSEAGGRRLWGALGRTTCTGHVAQAMNALNEMSATITHVIWDNKSLGLRLARNFGCGMAKQVVTTQQLQDWRGEALALAPELSVELDWLLREAAGVEPRILSYAAGERAWELPGELNGGLESLTELWRRHWQAHEPLQYLVGRSPWRRFDLKVAPGVLVPRPETELIVEIAAQRVGEVQEQLDIDLSQGTWADLGTGTGAISLGLAELLPEIVIHAVDCSEVALGVAAENLRTVQDGAWQRRIQLHQGKWFEPLQPLFESGLKLAGLVSNPPYIPTAMLNELQPEVRLHEPSLALDGGEDGLDCLRHLVNAGSQSLQPGGLWLVELMAGQAKDVKALLAVEGNYQSITAHFDLCGIERFVSAVRCNT